MASAATLLYEVGAPDEASDLLLKRGVVDREIYHRSRAAQQGFPDGLQHLAKIENKPSKHILEVWDREVADASSVEEAVRNLENPETWTEFAGAPLNRSQRYREAFWLYRETGLVDHMLDNLEQTLDQGDLSGDADNLFIGAVELLVDEKEWTALNELLGSATHKLSDSGYQRVRSETMRRIALTPKRTRIRQDLQKEFASLARRWIEVDNPNPAVAGIALERIGRFKAATEFYDGYVDADAPDLRSFARMRYIATANQWAEYYLEEEKLSAAISLENEVERRIEAWDMDSADIKVVYNAIDRTHDSVQRIIDASSNGETNPGGVSRTDESINTESEGEDNPEYANSSSSPTPNARNGQPEDDLPESDDGDPDSGSDEVETPNLDITLRLERNEQSRRIRIYFESEDNGASIDFDRRDVAPQGWVELDKKSDEDNVKFRLSPEDEEGTRVEGTITKGENPCARLNIEGLDHPLEISL